MVNDNTTTAKHFNNKYKFYLFLILKYKFIILACLIIGLVYSFYKARYLEPTYRTFCRVLIEDDYSTYSKNTFLPGMQLFGSRNKMVNEIGIIKSFSLVKKALLNTPEANINYTDVGVIRRTSIYLSSPFKVVILDKIDELPSTSLMEIKLNKTSFNIKNEDLELDTSFSYGVPFKLKNNSGKTINLKIVLRDGLYRNELSEKKFEFNITNINYLARSYREKLSVEDEGEYSTILNMSLTGKNKNKEIAILNKISEQYLDYGLVESQKVAENTLNFITIQLKSVLDSLIISENQLKNFKLSSNISKIDLKEEQAIPEIIKLEKERKKILFNLDFYKKTKTQLIEHDNTDGMIIPFFINTSNSIYVLIKNVLDLYAKKKLLEKDFTKENSPINRINEEIANQKRLLISNLNSVIELKSNEIDIITNQLTSFEKKLKQLPDAERKFVVLKRDYTINNDLYVFLLKKKSEAGIAKASKISKAKILDAANIYNIDVIIKHKSTVYRENIFLFLFISGVIIALLEIINSKIFGRADVERLTQVPILGSIIKAEDTDLNNNLILIESNRSIISENFRTLRSNINFMISRKEKGNVILVTSSVSGEGKTFCSSNLALSYAFANRKTLLIGCDLRKPKLNHYFSEIKKDVGLSNILQNGEDYKNLIIPSDSYPCLDILSSGPIPPNPSEILANEKINNLFRKIKKDYDYIIVDTSPTIVSDIFSLVDYSDLTLFIVKEDLTKYKHIKTLETYYQEKKMKNLGVVINGSKKLSRIYKYRNYGDYGGYY